MLRRKEISIWLLVVASFIVLIVLVGGLTRLTQSGLSIVEWNLVTGIFPPLSEESWNIEFDKYKTSPEFKVLNSNISFSDFKTIYFWEYFHRLLARLVGLVAIIPLLYFFIKNKINKYELRNFLIIPLLILIQGVIGWMMVKSGLNMKTYNGIGVSHYWLSLHLFLALTTYSIVVWQYLCIQDPLKSVNRNKMNYGFLIFFMIFSQIILGALLSGMDAGYITSNFPDINGEFYPEKSIVSFSNPYFLHFAHRWFPFIIMLICIGLYNKVKSDLSHKQKGLFLILLFVFVIQMVLGIMTILTSINISMAIMHQINAIVLLTVALIIAFSLSSK